MRHISRSAVTILSGKGLVVHEEEVDIVGVVDEESLVAGRHQVTGFLVRTVADLRINHLSSAHRLGRIFHTPPQD